MYISNKFRIKKKGIVIFCALISLTLLEVSFMGIPDAVGSTGNIVGSLAVIKFSIYIFSFLIISLCLFLIPKEYIKFDPIVLCFLLYLFISFISLVIYGIQHLEFNIVVWLRLIGMVFLVPYIWVLRSIEPKSVIGVALISKLVPIAIICILFFLNKESVMRQIWDGYVLIEPRLGGVVIPPNTLGAMLGIVIIIISTSKIRMTSVPLLVLLTIMLLATQSRTAIIATALCVPLGHFTSSGNIKVLFQYIALTVIGLFFYFITPLFLDSIDQGVVFSRFDNDTSTFGGRMQLWIQGAHLFSISEFYNILFGVGYMLPNVFFYTGGLVTNSIHNGFFSVLLGTGLVGFVTYMAIWRNLFVFRLNRRQKAWTFYSLFYFLFIFNVTELGALVLVNSMTLTIIILMGLASSVENMGEAKV